MKVVLRSVLINPLVRDVCVVNLHMTEDDVRCINQSFSESDIQS